jgi:hypothetical protein
MSLNIQPAIETVLAELVSSSVIIAVGIYLEYRKFDRLSIAINVVGFLIMALTTHFDVLVMPILGLYLVIGVLIAVREVEWLYGFFGSKTYGALLLAIAVFHTPMVQPLYSSILSVSTMKEGWDVLLWFYTWLLITWTIIAIVVWIVAKVVKPKDH